MLLSVLCVIVVVGSTVLGDDDDLTVCEAPSPTLEPFVEVLTFPPVLDLTNSTAITLGGFKISQKVHRDLPDTTFYAFGTSLASATYPGPTLLVTRGLPVHVNWENHIPDASHFLGTDNAIPWANPSNGGVPIVTHLHGGEVESYSDGHPDAWFTLLNETGPTYHTRNYTYHNTQLPSALWYHDHTQGITRLNLIAGLMGFYIFLESVTNPGDSSKEVLPMGLPLLIKDMRFLVNGSINFPFYTNIDGSTKLCAEYGDTILVNGKVSPFVRVLRQQYRFRLLNGANGRFLELTLSDPTLSFLKIGTDGGLLLHKQQLTSLLFSPGERLDVLIDFSTVENGSEVVLINTLPAPFPIGKLSYSTNGTFYVMKFMVDDTNGIKDGLFNDTHLASLSSQLARSGRNSTDSDDHLTSKILVNNNNITVRSFTMRSFPSKHGEPNHLILDNKTWSDPVTDFPIAGSTEVWELINLGVDAHNMHLHLVNFQLLNEQEFLVQSYESGSCGFDIPYGESRSCFTGSPRFPEEGALGWKDTIIAWPNNVTRLLVQFSSTSGDPFPFDATVGPGYLWHCHTGDHEDYEMIRPFKLRVEPFASFFDGR